MRKKIFEGKKGRGWLQATAQWVLFAIKSVNLSNSISHSLVLPFSTLCHTHYEPPPHNYGSKCGPADILVAADQLRTHRTSLHRSIITIYNWWMKTIFWRHIVYINAFSGKVCYKPGCKMNRVRFIHKYVIFYPQSVLEKISFFSKYLFSREIGAEIIERIIRSGLRLYRLNCKLEAQNC